MLHWTFHTSFAKLLSYFWEVHWEDRDTLVWWNLCNTRPISSQSTDTGHQFLTIVCFCSLLFLKAMHQILRWKEIEPPELLFSLPDCSERMTCEISLLFSTLPFSEFTAQTTCVSWEQAWDHFWGPAYRISALVLMAEIFFFSYFREGVVVAAR